MSYPTTLSAESAVQTKLKPVIARTLNYYTKSCTAALRDGPASSVELSPDGGTHVARLACI